MMKLNLRWFFGVLVLIVILLTNTTTNAQKGFTPLHNITDLQAKLRQSAASTKTISSLFTQVKHMSMLNDKVVSKGDFKFKQKDKVRINYQSPFSYLLVMNGSQILIKEGNKVNKVSTRNSKTMQSVSKIFMDCMGGSIFQNTDFSFRAFSSPKQYLLILTPKNPTMSNLFSSINIYLNKQDYSIDKLEMKEKSGDFTDMTFTHKKQNVPLDDALFSVR